MTCRQICGSLVNGEKILLCSGLSKAEVSITEQGSASPLNPAFNSKEPASMMT